MIKKLLLPDLVPSAIIYPLYKVGDKMLNYANLNDMEFEALCKDIMERMLKVSLWRFGPGRDHGVDLTDDVSSKSIVVQVKHYRNSTTDQLVRSLKNELPKVTELNPQQYYICCSRELSADNINALYQHFQAYMASARHIVTLIEIDDFLKQEANRDILKKHFKLWLDSTGILEDLLNGDIFVDCEALLSDVDDLQKLFVRTSAFDKALKVLESNQPLCIIGDPGVGKSITSKMLVLHYAAQGYRVRYTTDVTDLKSLKKSLRDDAATPEVILLDDCFGQAYFEMKTSQSSELVALIKYVKLHPNKVLILNSRVTIFQEARERQQELVRCMERKEFRVHVLDMNNLSGEEKAKILYNHLAFSGISDAYFENIRVDRRYHNIISHRNYNPRIIEFVCNPNRYSKIPDTQFYEYIMKQLDNPQEIWANEYDDRLQPADRILLQTIYSMTTTTVNAVLVRRCFERRIAGIPTIDKTLDQYTRSLNRLNEGFIKIIDNRGSQELSMQNPSVNDFLDSRLRVGTLEYQELIDSICTDKQLRLIPEKELLPYAVDLLQTGKIDAFIFIEPRHRSRFIARCLLTAKLCIDRYRTDLLNFLAMTDGSDYWAYSSSWEKYGLMCGLEESEIWEFYGLKDFFLQADYFDTVLRQFDLENAVSLINAAEDYYYLDDNEFFVECVTAFLDDSIGDYCKVYAEEYDYLLDIEAAVNAATTISVHGSSVDIPKAVSILETTIKKKVSDSLKNDLLWLPSQFIDYQRADYTNEIMVEGTVDLIENYLSELAEDDSNQEGSSTQGYSSIDAIFER